MTPFAQTSVATVFAAYSPAMREQFLLLRELIFAVAAETHGVGVLEETLKWGEPAYLTTASKSGSTLRLGYPTKKNTPPSSDYAIHFNCRTTLIDQFRQLFPHELQYQGNRSIVFFLGEDLPIEELRVCLMLALTYHLRQKPR